jgi:hypothetical protein
MLSKQLGHAKPTTTLDHYAKWLPGGEQRFVNVLDTQSENVGTKTWHQVDGIEKKDSEVVEKCDGPCRDFLLIPLLLAAHAHYRCAHVHVDHLSSSKE